MAHLTITVQVMHVTKTVYQPWGVLLNNAILACTICIYALTFFTDNYTFPRFHAVFMIILTVIGQWRYILNMIWEISAALSIRIFCVKDKQAYIVSDKIFSDSTIQED